MKAELGFSFVSAAPEVNPADVARLVGELRRAKAQPVAEGARKKSGRLSAAELAVIFYGNDSETSKRRIRAIAKAARPRVVSFPGSDGYDLWSRCTQPEILHAIEAMQAAGRTYLDEALVYSKAYHAQYRGEPGDDEQGALL